MKNEKRWKENNKDFWIAKVKRIAKSFPALKLCVQRGEWVMGGREKEE